MSWLEKKRVVPSPKIPERHTHFPDCLPEIPTKVSDIPFAHKIWEFAPYKSLPLQQVLDYNDVSQEQYAVVLRGTRHWAISPLGDLLVKTSNNTWTTEGEVWRDSERELSLAIGRSLNLKCLKPQDSRGSYNKVVNLTIDTSLTVYAFDQSFFLEAPSPEVFFEKLLGNQ